MLKARFTVTHKSYTGSTGDQGYPTADQWSEDAVSRPAFGWYPLASQLNMTGEYDRRVITSKVLQVPDATVYKARDRVALPGDDIEDDNVAFFVSEDVRDYNTGPFGFKPGGEVVLEKVTG